MKTSGDFRGWKAAPRPLRRAVSAYAFLAVLALSAGCSTLRIKQEPVINREAFDQNPPGTLAVLPFTNASGVKEANEEARKSFYSALSGLGYEDVEPEEVDSALSRLAVAHQLAPEELPPPLIRGTNLADAILTADVLEVSKFWFIFYSHIKVKMCLELIDSRTGQILYQNKARGINYSISAPMSPGGIVTGAFRTLWHLKTGEMTETFEELSQELVKGFPDTSHVAEGGDYYIRDIKLGLPGDPIRAGQALTLQFYGTPGLRAYFDLGNIVTNIPITEIKPGYYGVRYVIEPGQSAQYCVVTCRLLGGLEPVEAALHQKPFSVGGNGS
jgi:hypothetical protein